VIQEDGMKPQRAKLKTCTPRSDSRWKTSSYKYLASSSWLADNLWLCTEFGP